MALTREDVAKKSDGNIENMIYTALAIRSQTGGMPSHLAEQEIWAYEEVIKRKLDIPVPGYIDFGPRAPEISLPDPVFKLTMPED